MFVGLKLAPLLAFDVMNIKINLVVIWNKFYSDKVSQIFTGSRKCCTYKMLCLICHNVLLTSLYVVI